MSRAVFLDRDGTLCVDVPYARRPEEIVLLPGSAEAVRCLRGSGFVAILVTNQSGIARGYFTEEDLHRMNAKLQNDLQAAGAFLDGIYWCPHHPDARCPCRKPRTLLVETAAHELCLDPARSYVIGDRLMDMQLARAVGGTGILVQSLLPEEERHAAEETASYVANGIMDAADWILAREAGREDSGPGEAAGVRNLVQSGESTWGEGGDRTPSGGGRPSSAEDPFDEL